jgi:hypothetical protein
MANLFIVFTPFQLFVAQQIVNQEKLADNILIEGYVGNNSHFYDIYDMMAMENYWKKRIHFPDIVSWDGLRTTSIKDAKKAYANYKKIKNILINNNIDTIYISEFQNQAMRFTDVLFSHQGYKVIFFEEGSAHYVNRPYVPDNSFRHKLKIFLRDALYYLPIYHVRFAKWRYNVNMPYDELPIYKRYNILPFHHEPYDVELKVSEIASDRIKKYMESEIIENESNRALLMTDPMAELIHEENMYIYFDTIKGFINEIPKETTVHIKYHPRDPQESRKKTEEVINNIGINYKILSKDINVPVEYYLQKYRFDKVFIFNASTYFYNGYVYPHCDFIKMLPSIYNKCIE